MKPKQILLTVVAIVFATLGGYGLYTLGTKQSIKAATPALGNLNTPNTIVEKMQGAEKKVLYWHDPMVPGHKFDKPGKSPFMDMELVPMVADTDADDSENAGIRISSRIQQNLGIRTAEVIKGTLIPKVVAVGTVAYDERTVALVQARNNGFVEKLLVRAPLDVVRKGQTLAELYVPEWVAAQEEFLALSRMQVSGLEGLLDAGKQRMRLVGMSDAQIRLIETSGKVHPRLTIHAPIGGIVTELAVREGMTVAMGTPLFRINGIDTVWINADIPESLSALVRSGSKVEARTPSLPSTVFKGVVSAILPQLETATRTLKARIELANTASQLVPGMFVTLNVNGIERKDVLLVPTEAVITTGKRNVLIVVQADGKFLPVEVETGMEENDQTEIIKGVEVGQKIVSSGQFLIDSEASLKASITRIGALGDKK